MAKFLDTRGRSSIAIAICERCSTKTPIVDIAADRDSGGLRVCGPCNDEVDPYKLPPRSPENIALQYPRPDEPLTP